MTKTSSILEDFPVERQLRSAESIRDFRVGYSQVRGIIERVALERRLREAAAKGWITLPSKTRGAFAPMRLPGRPLSELLNEVRD
jgi:hypothetical protein